MALTPKQERFVQEYLVDLNATQAAIRAEYSQKTAYSMGQRLLKKVEIQSALQEARAKTAKKLEITRERVILEYARIAFFDPRRLFEDNGNPKNVSELDEDTAAALAGLDVVQEVEDETKTYTKKYKAADKLRALEALGKHLGIFDGDGGEDADTGVVMLAPGAEEPKPPPELVAEMEQKLKMQEARGHE